MVSVCDPIEVVTYASEARFTVPRDLRTKLNLPRHGDIPVHLRIEHVERGIVFEDDWLLKSGSEVYGEKLRQAGVEAGGQRLIVTVGRPWDESKIFPSIVAELNKHASKYQIGRIQAIRAKRKDSGRTKGDLFPSQTMHLTPDRYAFHLGGRKELQFNVGFEEVPDERTFRFGVAFSLEPNRNLTSPIEVLGPKIALFNKFVESNPDDSRSLRMWHWRQEGRFGDYMPSPIPLEHVRPGVFIFLGKRVRPADIDYEAILAQLDRLLPLYRYVESGGRDDYLRERSGIDLAPKEWVERPETTTATPILSDIDIDLRHNRIQSRLRKELISRYGEENVFPEAAARTGNVDLAVRHAGELWLYEIKTGSSARTCLRQAVGQLLEYSLWPGNDSHPPVGRLIVVGEHHLDGTAAEYLHRLNKRFPLPLVYEHLECL